MPRLERRFFPTPYEERRIFFSVSQEVRAASNLKQLYAAIARRIAESFEANTVSILVRNEVNGDYVCSASSSQTGGQSKTETVAPKPRLRLAHDGFVVNDWIDSQLRW